MKYAEEFLLCCTGICLALFRINPPVQLRQNSTEFSVAVFFMKPHELFTRFMSNLFPFPNPFLTSTIIKSSPLWADNPDGVSNGAPSSQVCDYPSWAFTVWDMSQSQWQTNSRLLPQVEIFCYAATFMEHLHAILRPVVDLPPLLTRNEVKSVCKLSSLPMGSIHANYEGDFSSVESEFHPVLLQASVSRANTCIVYNLGNILCLVAMIFEKSLCLQSGRGFFSSSLPRVSILYDLAGPLGTTRWLWSASLGS